MANPKGFKRIGLRYINKIEIKAESVEVGDYVDFFPHIPQDLPQVHTRFLSRIEIPYQNHRDRMLLTIGNTRPETPNTTLIVLDIHYIMSVPEAISMEEFENWLDQGHSVVEKTFELCIKDKSRILFGEVK
ncbi:TIGR04255 family protein [Candidatus Aerophobetes bacterium]|nr:TIGR04255 family protein [Candidatus Aerophobetes bacterium]